MVTYSDAKRAQTFDVDTWNSPSRYRMASCGFIYVAPDTVQCVFCNVKISGWNKSDMPLVRHVVACQESETVCDYLQNYDEMMDEESVFDWSALLYFLSKMGFDKWCKKAIELQTRDE